MSKKRLHTKRTTLHIVIRNEQRFPLLLGTNNAFKNLHGVVGNKERFSDKKFLIVIAYLQSEILIFLVFVSLGELTFWGGGYITKISGNMTPVSGNMTSGEMTLGRLDRLPVIAQVILYNAAENFIHKFLWLFNKFH